MHTLYAQTDPRSNIWEFASYAYTISAIESFQRILQRKRGVGRLTQLHTRYVPTHEKAFINRTSQEQANGNDYKLTSLHQSDLPS